MIYVDNLDRVSQDLDTWVKSVEAKVVLKTKGTAVKALQWLTTHSPQFSGDFAANWKVAVNGVDASFEDHAVSAKWTDPRGSAFGIAPFKQGDRPAIDYAVQRGFPQIAKVKFGDYVMLSNSALHDEAYAWKIENNQVKFRPENPEGGRVVARFMASFGSLPT